jgi:hypothetical protein
MAAIATAAASTTSQSSSALASDRLHAASTILSGVSSRLRDSSDDRSDAIDSIKPSFSAHATSVGEIRINVANKDC